MTHDPLSFEAVTDFMREVVRTSPRNRLQYIDGSPIFDTPLCGVADGDDPLFDNYKDIVGPFHLTPREIYSSLAHSSKHGQGRADVLGVLCWVLPITDATRESNARMTEMPSRRWAHTYYYGEMFNNEMRRKVEQYLRNHGAFAVAPLTSPLFQTLNDKVGEPTSTWSERHALYAAGMGTFGLCDGFLTEKGKAMRCGSVVTDVPLPITPRQYQGHKDACPYMTDGTCGSCIARCPAGAITPHGHDKIACKRYQDETAFHLKTEYRVQITGCGLCQTRVPCESRIP